MSEVTEQPTNAGRMPDGTFAKGSSHNPKGKAKGTRNLATRALESLLDGEGEQITRKCIELAKNGDLTAIRLVMDRTIAPRKDRPTPFEMPEIKSAEDTAGAICSVLNEVAAGSMTASEGDAIVKIIGAYASNLEIGNIQKRLEALESRDER